MRVAELLRLDVTDATGSSLGRVNDVRLVQDGPYVEGFGAALRVDGLVVGGGAVAARLGYHRHRVRGPWLLKLLFTRLERRAHYVDWRHVAGVDGSGITLGCTAGALPTLRDLPEEP